LVTFFKVGDEFGYELVTSLELWESWEKSIPAHVAPLVFSHGHSPRSRLLASSYARPDSSAELKSHPTLLPQSAERPIPTKESAGNNIPI